MNLILCIHVLIYVSIRTWSKCLILGLELDRVGGIGRKTLDRGLTLSWVATDIVPIELQAGGACI